MITVKSAKGFNSTEMQKFHEVIGYANLVLLDEGFKNAIIATPSFSNTKHDGQAVWDRLSSSDLSVDFYLYELSWFRRWSSEIARESNGRIGIRRSYFARAEIPVLVNTVIHECTHKAGYSHDWGNTARRPNSVPYLLGSFAEKVSKRFIKTNVEPLMPINVLESATSLTPVSPH